MLGKKEGLFFGGGLERKRLPNPPPPQDPDASGNQEAFEVAFSPAREPFHSSRALNAIIRDAGGAENADRSDFAQILEDNPAPTGELQGNDTV